MGNLKVRHASLNKQYYTASFLAGKDARKSGAGSFISAASRKYHNLEEDEKDRLAKAAKEDVVAEMSVTQRRRMGAKLFRKIEKQVHAYRVVYWIANL